MSKTAGMRDHTENTDDIDRLFKLAEREDPAPGPAFADTLKTLRQASLKEGSNLRKERPWRKVVLAGLGIAAVLVAGFIAAAVFFGGNTPDQKPVVAVDYTVPATAAQTSTTANQVPETTTASAATGAPTNVSGTIDGTTSASSGPNPGGVTTMDENTTNPATSAGTPPATSQAAGTTNAAPTPTTKQASNPNPVTAKPTVAPASPTTVAAPTPAPTTTSAGGRKGPGSVFVPADPLPSVSPVPGQGQVKPPTSVNGRIVGYDQAAGIIRIPWTNGDILAIRITGNTVITMNGAPMKASDIVVGDTIIATGLMNAQGQFEAATISVASRSGVRPH